MADKIYRIIEEDADKDGSDDITISHGSKKIVTVYDWKSVLVSWVATTTALFAAGMGVITFGL